MNRSRRRELIELAADRERSRKLAALQPELQPSSAPAPQERVVRYKRTGNVLPDKLSPWEANRAMTPSRAMYRAAARARAAVLMAKQP